MSDSDARGPGKGMNRMRRNRGKQGGKDNVLFDQHAWRTIEGLSSESLEEIVCCVDDTDDLSGETSTGAIAEAIAREVSKFGGYVELGITRHQLLLAEGVPYTSHNSSMAFMAKLPSGGHEDLLVKAVEIIKRDRAQTSDPGICVAVVPENARNDAVVRQMDALERFGHRAQKVVCTKDEAYELAAPIPWLTLEEHGGTGDGVIGALAGCALRLAGNDGRFRGQWDLRELLHVEDGCHMVEAHDLTKRLSRLVGGSVLIVDPSGEEVDGSSLVEILGKVKPVLLRGSLALVADEWVGESGVLLQLRENADPLDRGPTAERAADSVETGVPVPDVRVACDFFSSDNDVEEMIDQELSVCRNCLYRRWTSEGFRCVNELANAG